MLTGKKRRGKGWTEQGVGEEWQMGGQNIRENSIARVGTRAGGGTGQQGGQSDKLGRARSGEKSLGKQGGAGQEHRA